jgi:hypothetical protein
MPKLPWFLTAKKWGHIQLSTLKEENTSRSVWVFQIRFVTFQCIDIIRPHYLNLKPELNPLLAKAGRCPPTVFLGFYWRYRDVIQFWHSGMCLLFLPMLIVTERLFIVVFGSMGFLTWVLTLSTLLLCPPALFFALVTLWKGSHLRSS